MHAILIQFHSELTGHDLMATLPPQWMGDLLKTDGLIMKTFIGTSPNDLGGMYLFRDAEAAGRYLESGTFAAIASHSAVSSVTVQHFGVVPEPSTLCGTPSQLLAA